MWAHDGKRLAFHSNARDGVSYDIYIVDVAAGTPPRLAIGGQQDTWYPLDWSPDDTKLLLWKYVSINESYLFIADVNTGSVTPLERRDAATSAAAKEGDGKVRIRREVRAGRPRHLHRLGRRQRVRAAALLRPRHAREAHGLA